MLEIRLLGQFDLQKHGEPVQLPLHSAQSLVAYLALNPRKQHRREKLAGLLWPDMLEGSARRNLRHSLWQVRNAIGPEYIQATRLSLSFNLEPPHWIDCEVLQNGPDDSSASLAASMQVYRGELLPGFYDSWVAIERERFRNLYDRRINRLLDNLQAEARWMEVLRWADHWIKFGDAPEGAFQALMCAHHALGHPQAVTTVYQRCKKLLSDELGVLPSEQTETLYKQLQQNQPSIHATSSRPAVTDSTAIDPAVQRTSQFTLLNRLVGSRLIGRELELAELVRFWQRAQTGSGCFIMLTGDAGVGKTRLVNEFIKGLVRQGGKVLVGQYDAGLEVPYLGFWGAIRDHLRGLDKPTAQAAVGPLASELVKLVPEIVEIISPITPSSRLGSQGAERLRLFDSITQFVRHLAAQGPVLFVLEDLHWMDPASGQLLQYIVKHTQEAPVLFVGLYRDHEIHLEHPLHQALLTLNRERLYTRLQLHPLPDAQVHQLLSTLLAGPITPSLAEAVASAAGGLPLFVEEIVKSLVENQQIGLMDGYWTFLEEERIQVPQNIEMMIERRLSSLSPDCQTILKNAAVLGQEFDAAVLHHWLQWEEKPILLTLEEAIQSGMLAVEEIHGRTHYSFNHALVQQTLYTTLSTWDRAQAHLNAGRAVEAVHIGAIDDYVEILAHHFGNAHEKGVLKAADYLLRAAEKAAAVYAHDQAIDYLKRGLDLLASYPSLNGRDHDEIRLLLALGPLIENTAGRWDAEVGRIFIRAASLCQQIKVTAHEHFSATRGLWHYHLAARNEHELPALTARLLALAEESGDSGLLLEAYHTLWGHETSKGHYRQAQEYYDLGRALFDFETHQDLSRQFGHDPGTCCLNMGAFNLWLLGYPDQAIEWSHAAYALGQQMALPFDRLCGLNAYVWVYEMRGEYAKAARWNEVKLALARETEFPQFIIGALGSQGLALASQGAHDEGFFHAQEAMGKNRAASRYEPLTLMRFLQVCTLTGHIQAGLDVMEAVLEENPITGETFLESELRRYYGELLFQQSPADPNAAEAQYHLSLGIARQQEARSLELRAALSLARMWQSQGKNQLACQLLQPIYTWFTEGFDTADLIEARRLLAISR